MVFDLRSNNWVFYLQRVSFRGSKLCLRVVHRKAHCRGEMVGQGLWRLDLPSGQRVQFIFMRPPVVESRLCVCAHGAQACRPWVRLM